MKFPQSKNAHRWIDPLQPGPGLEIGGSAHNPWGIPNTWNVDYTDDMETIFKLEEQKLCNEKLKVDYVAEGDNLPFKESGFAWILNSHVFEHLPNPIAALYDWHRVLRHDGIIYSHIPHSGAHPPDRERPISTLTEILDAFIKKKTIATHILEPRCHYYVWDVDLYVNMVKCIIDPVAGQAFDILETMEVDDKVGNSFVVVLKAKKQRRVRKK